MGRGVVAAALPPREVGPHQVNRGRGQALPSRRPWGPYAGVRGRPASSRCTRGEGGGGGEAGRRKPTTKLASPSARLDLNGRSPRSRSAAETLESALGRLGAACGRSRYRARAAGWAEGSAGSTWAADSDFSPGADGPAAARGGAVASRPSVGALHRGHAGELSLGGTTTKRSGPGRGLSSSLARGWSQPLGHSRCAHLERI